MKKTCKCKLDELHCCEAFVNVAMNNDLNLTTEQVENVPIYNEERKVIGKLTDADEDNIYGIVYSVRNLYPDNRENKTISFEILKGEDGK